MKKQMIFTLFSIALLAASCQKEKTVKPSSINFVEKTWAPTGEVEAKAKVTTFLSHLSSSEIDLRSNYSDTEVNEARWILEGSGNYIANVNIPNHDASDVQVYTLTINNVTANNELKMEGAEMTSKFSDLLNSIAAHETQSGEVAMAVDMKLTQVSSAASEVEAKVMYGKVREVENPPPFIAWNVAIFTATSDVNSIIDDLNLGLPGVGCSWTPEVEVYKWEFGDPELYCYEGINQVDVCMHKIVGQGDGSAVLYDSANLPNDTQIALTIGQEYIENLNNPGDGSAPNYPWVLTSMQVSSRYYQYEEPVEYYERFLFVSSILARGLTYCY